VKNGGASLGKPDPEWRTGDEEVQQRREPRNPPAAPAEPPNPNLRLRPGVCVALAGGDMQQTNANVGLITELETVMKPKETVIALKSVEDELLTISRLSPKKQQELPYEKTEELMTKPSYNYYNKL
jgi:hypothetical protein